MSWKTDQVHTGGGVRGTPEEGSRPAGVGSGMPAWCMLYKDRSSKEGHGARTVLLQSAQHGQ